MSLRTAEAAMEAVRRYVPERSHAEVWRRLLEAVATPADREAALASLRAQEVSGVAVVASPAVPPGEVLVLDKSKPSLLPTGAVGVLDEASRMAARAYGTPSLEEFREACCRHGLHGAKDCHACRAVVFQCAHHADSRTCPVCQVVREHEARQKAQGSRAWEQFAPKLKQPTPAQQAHAEACAGAEEETG